MSIVLLILLFAVLVLAIAVLVARFYPGNVLDVMGLDAQTLAEQRRAVEAADMEQLLELENRRRRAAGLREVGEDELRYRVEH
jgi:hypothetical protein